MKHLQPPSKLVAKKHRRIKSQQLFDPALSSKFIITDNDLKKHQRTSKRPQLSYVIQVFKPNNQTVKIIIQCETKMGAVKDTLCRKLQLNKKVVSFYSLDNDYNFDYRFQEEIGVLAVDKRLGYKYRQINTQNNEQFRQGADISDYNIYDCLSVGGFSKVFLVRSKKSGQFYAAKFIDKNFDSSAKFKQLIMNQKFINQNLDYPLLVKMHQFIQTKQFYIFIIDYCPSGQLFCLMKAHRDMSQSQAKFYFIQTILGIDHMHSKSIIYRDLKPQNVLLDKDGHVKIADFGLAKIMRQKSTSYCGSLQYMAPEIVLGNQHSFGVDHYCLGSLLFEMMVGCPPFYNPNFSPSQTKYHIVSSKVKFPSHRKFSDQLIDFISKLLDKNPKTRLGSRGGIKQILSHPWIGKFNRANYQKHLINPPYVVSLDKSNFQTSYLPKQAIEQTIKKIKKEIEQKSKEKRKINRQKNSLIMQNAFCDQGLYRNRLKSSQSQHKYYRKKSQESANQNVYEVHLSKQKRSSKKLSFSSSKNINKSQSTSVHQAKNNKSLQIPNKRRSATKNLNSYKQLGSPKNTNNFNLSLWKRQKQYIKKNSENAQQLKRSHNNTLHRKSSNFQKQNGFKFKFQTKPKGVKKLLGQYMRNTCMQENQMKNMRKQTNYDERINKVIIGAFQK